MPPYRYEGAQDSALVVPVLAVAQPEGMAQRHLRLFQLLIVHVGQAHIVIQRGGHGGRNTLQGVAGVHGVGGRGVAQPRMGRHEKCRCGAGVGWAQMWPAGML
jgi:hypothetical protein